MIPDYKREEHMARLRHSGRLLNHFHNPWRNSSQTYDASRLAIKFMLDGHSVLFIHEGDWYFPRNEISQQLDNPAFLKKYIGLKRTTHIQHRKISCGTGGSIQFMRFDDDRFERALGFKREYVILDNDHGRKFREGEGDTGHISTKDWR
jgi:hypothetical protein